MPTIAPEVWAGAAIIVGLLISGVIGRVWRPVRKAVSAIDVIAGRPERYPGDEEARPGLAERFDRVDSSIKAIRTDLDAVKQHVGKWEVEGSS